MPSVHSFVQDVPHHTSQTPTQYPPHRMLLAKQVGHHQSSLQSHWGMSEGLMLMVMVMAMVKIVHVFFLLEQAWHPLHWTL